MFIFFLCQSSHHMHRTRTKYILKVMAAYAPMIYVVNSPKLAYLWSLMSEVKCVMRNHTPNYNKRTTKMPNGHKLFTQHRQYANFSSTTRKKNYDTTFERDVLIFWSIELFTLKSSLLVSQFHFTNTSNVPCFMLTRSLCKIYIKSKFRKKNINQSGILLGKTDFRSM